MLEDLTDSRIQEILQGNLSDTLPERCTLLNGRVLLEREHPTGEKKEITLFDKCPRDILDTWPLNPGYSSTSDPTICNAVMVPRQNIDLQTAVSSLSSIAGSCVTPNEGVEIMISNLVGNTNLRYLIIAGQDSGHMSGDVAMALHRNGVDEETGRVIGTKSPTSPYLRRLVASKEGREIIQRFRQQITPINLMFNDLTPDQLKLFCRLTMQEPQYPVRVKIDHRGEIKEHLLYDPGYLTDEHGRMIDPIWFKYKDSLKFGEGCLNSRVGGALFATTVTEGRELLRNGVADVGSFARFESGIEGIDCVGLQVSVHDLENGLVPEDYKPMSHLVTPEQVKQYLDTYSTWVYLFPHSDVKWDEASGKTVPFIRDFFRQNIELARMRGQMTREEFLEMQRKGLKEIGYVYGSQLSTFGWQFADPNTQEEIIKLVESIQSDYQHEPPSFDRTLEFHNELTKILVGQDEAHQESRVVDMIKDIGLTATKSMVDRGITPYRLYMNTQDPRLHVSSDPAHLHPPCFALYQLYPRTINGQYQLDSELILRAHAEKAFVANAHGGIKMNKFFAWHAGIKPGVYVHHSGCFQLYADDLDKELLERKRLEALGK